MPLDRLGIPPCSEPVDDLEADIERLDVGVPVLAWCLDPDNNLGWRNLAASNLPNQSRRAGSVGLPPAVGVMEPGVPQPGQDEQGLGKQRLVQCRGQLADRPLG